MNSDRPDPDALLRRVQEASVRQSRATLKIFFGFAPGVGKTYAMLESAQRLRAQGVDVVVGCVETHGRSETAALLDGLEILPRKKHVYRGATLDEFDLEAAIARQPRILLLDELAHSNAEGSRHAKRHQDVFDLLDAGIDVHTTLNVQHVESINDTIAQITGVRVRETVPDALLERADEIELIDLPPEELLARMHAGKVYVPEQAERAVQGFFRRGNLLALRELALRRVAERVDADVRAYREINSIRAIVPANEHVLVCVGAAPASAQLVRAAKRMAVSLHCDWTAAYVESVSQVPPSSADQSRLEGHLRLAEQLGGRVARLSGDSVSGALLDFARAQNVTRIVLGKPTHSRLRDIVRGSLLDEVVRGSGEIEVHVIAGEATATASTPVHPSTASTTPWPHMVIASLVIAAITAFGVALRSTFELTDIVVLYLVGIVAVASRSGRNPSLLAAALAVAAYDFFFVPPYYTFAISDARHGLTFSMMLGAGLVVSAFMGRLRRQELAAKTREARTAALYDFSRALAQATSPAEIATALDAQAATVMRVPTTVALLSDEGSLLLHGARTLSAADEAVVRWTLEHYKAAGKGTDTLPGSNVIALPMRITEGLPGAIVIDGAAPLGQEQRDLLQAFAQQAAIAIARARLATRVDAALLRARTEEIRSSLLSAVSHDLRTPLASITGASSTLRDASVNLGRAEQQELLESIGQEAARLESLVNNLLEMTKLESGAIVPSRETLPVEEVLGSALTRAEGLLGSREVHVDVPSDATLYADAVLLEHAIVNLLDNAAKHTPSGSPIDLAVRIDRDWTEIEIADRGQGIDEAERERIFEKFVRLPNAKKGGSGLGLAICKGIVDVHGGTIRVLPRDGGGARFVMRLPANAGARAT